MNEPIEVPDHNTSSSVTDMATLTIPQLISLFKSQNPNLVDKIEQALISKHHSLESKCRELEAKLEQKEKELQGCRITIDSLKQEVSNLYTDHVKNGMIVISDGENEDTNKGLDVEDLILTPNLKRKGFSRVVGNDSEEAEEDEEDKGASVKRKRVSRVVTINSENDEKVKEIVDDDDIEKKEEGGRVDDHEDKIDKNFRSSSTPNLKRNRVLRVVNSDSEDEEDNDDMKEKEMSEEENVKEVGGFDKESSGLDDHDDRIDNNFLSSSTPNLKRNRVSRVVTSDSEDEEANMDMKEKAMIKEEKVKEVGGIDKEEGSRVDDHDVKIDEDLLLSSTPKMKYGSRVVTIDSEGDSDDDYVPIGMLRLRNCGDNNVTPSSRRLVTLGELSRKKAVESTASPQDLAAENSKSNGVNLRTRSAVRQKLKLSDTEDEDEDDNGEEGNDGDSDSESDSLVNFIVSGSDISHGSESSANEGSEGEVNSSNDIIEEDSGSDVDLDAVLATLRRNKCDKEWQFEGDMLASFGKDPELCMKAVCALYRQQTPEEQSVKGSIALNGRGFNQLDALKASMIAEFLLDGETYGPPKKSVEDLEKRFSYGREYCYQIATRYSKQLFTIYKQNEDPFFGPS